MELTLTRGKKTQISNQDADLANVKWYAAYNPSVDGFYARRQVRYDDGKQRPEWLHRVILERMINRSMESNEFVDHINHDTLDNRRSNLRLATRQQNIQHSRPQRNNRTGYKGVSILPGYNRFRACIYPNGNRIDLGHYSTAIEAAKAYDKAAKKHYGEFAKLNFPEESHE